MAAVLRPIGELATPEAITSAVASTAAAQTGAELARDEAQAAQALIPTPEAINLQVDTRIDQLPPIPENASDIGAEPVGLSAATKAEQLATFVAVNEDGDLVLDGEVIPIEGGVSETELADAVLPKLDKAEAANIYATPAQVPPLVASAIAADGTVAAAAAAAAGPAVTTALATNPAVPRLANYDDYLTAEVSPAGKLLRGTRKDGSVEIPVARIAGGTTQAISSADYLKATTSPTGKVYEDALGLDGCVPAWVLARWASRMSLTPAALPFDIIISAGQSNSTQADTIPVTSEEVDTRIFRWNPTTLQIEQLSAADTYLHAAFAREYVKSQPPGRNVLIVGTGTGSTGFTSTSLTTPPAGYHYSAGGTWDRTLTADPLNLYARMIARATAAKAAAGAGARLVALLWSGNEEDRQGGGYGQVECAADLDDLFAQARIDLASPDLPVLIGSMTPETIWDGQRDGHSPTIAINAAHVDSPRRIQSSAFIFGPGDMVKHNEMRIHYSAQGQRARGKLFNEALYRARLNKATMPPIPPQKLRVTRSGDTVTATWEHPPTRATAFVLEYSVNGGAWTAATLAGVIATDATFTAAAASPIKVRARTTNEVGTSDNTREVTA